MEGGDLACKAEALAADDEVSFCVLLCAEHPLDNVDSKAAKLHIDRPADGPFMAKESPLLTAVMLNDS